jgi:glycosyltransferase involved in cell wall biosynthesis
MISLCITTYNRTDLLFESFAQVIDDDRISEIVIVDDHSDIEVFNRVFDYTRSIPKVKLYRNEKNLDCYRNKREAVGKASNEWVIIFDSDNILTKAYVDRLAINPVDPKKIWQPEFARPHFDFRKYFNNGLAGNPYDRHNIAKVIHEPTFQTMLNAMNYYVNRDEFIRVWDASESLDPVTSDSLFFNYNWLKEGNRIFVVNGLEYEHRVHDGSHYQNNVRRTPRGFHQEIENKLKQLK